MKKFIPIFIFCSFLYSCSNIRIVQTKRSFSDLAIDWNFAGKMNPVYKPKIDSTLDEIIRKFNTEPHSFKIHKREPRDEDYITFTFINGKFVSKGGVTAGYIVSGLGLIATPVATLVLSEGTWLAAFYYFPTDRLQISTMLSPSLAKKSRAQNSMLQSGALFSNRTKRINKMTGLLEKSIYRILVYLDKQVTSRK